ncbi:MAG: FAD-linked oxidase [Actinobacteria bacterium 13_2_20CM_2_71_6]|nr:MAG: FAD-linked oxidase [Actinobacteria bacterium 13_2_20CM_2_71_6]
MGPDGDRYAEHARAVEALRAAYAGVPAGAPVRLAKRTSNLFRFRAPEHGRGLDVHRFDNVLSVDPQARTADVQGMVTYERLVDATLRHGLMPLVVPQLKTITLGGAVAGLGIESSSFRNGMPHESVRELEVLTGDGRVVVARPDNEHADLFRGFPNSYGTLGYALRLTIDLEPVRPYVQLRHLRFATAAECLAELASVCTAGAYAGAPVDFVDGTVFGPDEQYLTLGTFVDEAPAVSDYTGMAVYYRSIQQREVDHLTVRDYLWRWDTDWFLSASVARLRGRPEEAVIQDVEVPVARTPEFLDLFHREIGITPVWLCPVRLRSSGAWPLYPLEPDELYVNVGFWSSVPLRPGQPDGYHNRLIEETVTALDGHKSLYSTVHYPAEEFWRRYNGAAYGALKGAYDPAGRLPDLYDKCVRLA